MNQFLLLFFCFLFIKKVGIFKKVSKLLCLNVGPSGNLRLISVVHTLEHQNPLESLLSPDFWTLLLKLPIQMGSKSLHF